MKRIVFHIALSVALFCVLTASFVGRADGGPAVHQVEKNSEDSVGFTDGAGDLCVGAPVEALEKPETVRSGDSVILAFKGESYTDYSIRVYYPSGHSEEKVLSPRKSDGQGRFGWELSVSEYAGIGKLRIAVLSVSSYLLTEIEIIG